MNELLVKRVRAAVAAGWWTLLIAYCILLIQWCAYWLIMAKHPAGMLCIWGEGATWPEIRTIWLSAMVAYKLGVGMMLFIVIWLTIWAKQLAKK